jgi:dipeptidyl aminopeptidase/acylaminoacyl peptidase
MAQPISPDVAIFEIPTLAGAVVSPDGTRIVWTRTHVSRETKKAETQIWVSAIDGSGARQLTHVGTANSEPVWSPDGSSLAFTTKRDGDKPNAIALLPFDGGEARLLVSSAKPMSGLAFSPDGSQIAFTRPVDPENPEETPRDPKAPAAVRVVKRIDYKQDGIGFVNDVRSQLFVLDVASGEARQLTSAPRDHARPTWSPDGTKIAVTLPIQNGMRDQLGVVDVASGEISVHGDETGTIGLLSWSPDGATIVFSGQQHASPHPDFTRFTVADGSFRKLIDNPAFTVDGSLYSTSRPAWLDEGTILVHGIDKGRSGIWTVDATTGEATPLGSWDSIHAGLSVDDAHTVIVQTVTDLTGLLGIVTVDLKTGERTVIHDEGKAIFAQTPVAGWEQVRIERAGFPVEGWLLKPADFDPRKRYPIVLSIHGGPHGFYSFTWNNHAEMLASNGFFVLISNPRGSSTYGRDFAEAVHNDWGGEDWKDLQELLDHVIASNPAIDGGRSGAVGYSYGGYMTSWALGHTDRFKAIVCGAPCFDLESFFGTSDIGHTFTPSQNGGTPWERREQLAAQSPSTFIHNAVTPTLIVHGEADERCPIGQGEQLFVSLKKLGVETEFARYPGGFHGFVTNGEPTHRLDYYERSLGWFKKYLGDPAGA